MSTEPLINRLKNDYINARTNTDTLKKDVLSTFIASVQTYEKAGKNIREITDAVVYKLLQDRINEHSKTIDQLKQVGRNYSEQEKERDVLQEYMPVPMSEDKLNQVVANAYSSCGLTGKKAIGKIMDVLKKDYAFQYDPARVMTIIDSLVS